MAAAPSLHPAGFWQRAVAWSLDAALLVPLAVLLAWPSLGPAARLWTGQVHGLLRLAGAALGEALVAGVPLPQLASALLDAPGLREAIGASHAAAWSLAWPAVRAFALLGAVYHVAAECSPWQGGLGKRALGLRACDRHGRRLAIGRATLRHLAASLSWATLNLGHLLAAVPPRHLSLHDRCSGTLVIGNAGALPRWAWAWIAMLAVAAVVMVGRLAGAASAALRAALELALY